MSQSPQVSVVVPYHAARAKNGMLQRAVNSVNRQTVPCVLLTVEDTSRQGAAVTRQLGLDKVTTPWVAFLDSDDELDPDHIEQLLTCADETGADYVYPWFRVKGGKDPFPQFFGKPWDNTAPHHTTITVMVRTELAQQVGFTPPDPAMVTGPNGNWGEDWEFTVGCMRAGAKIVHLPRRSWTWFHHGKNSSGLPTRGDARRR